MLAHCMVTLILVIGGYSVFMRPSDGQAAVSMVQTVTSKETCQLEPRTGYTIVRSHYRKKTLVVQN